MIHGILAFLYNMIHGILAFLYKKTVISKKNLIAARNLKDWTKFTTQINDTTNKKCVRAVCVFVRQNVPAASRVMGSRVMSEMTCALSTK